MRRAIFIVAAGCMLVFPGCEHDAAKIAAGKGDGGMATVNVFPRHNGVTANLINVKVYVKYNTIDAPANGVYDDSMACANYDSLVSCAFTGLRNGSYYFYGYGYDTSVSKNVKGGIPYTITTQNTQTLYLPVSEN